LVEAWIELNYQTIGNSCKKVENRSLLLHWSKEVKVIHRIYQVRSFKIVDLILNKYNLTTTQSKLSIFNLSLMGNCIDRYAICPYLIKFKLTMKFTHWFGQMVQILIQ
jgi:hypothetical protein